MPKYLPETQQETIVGEHVIKYWNTGRFYRPNGQRIVVARVTDNSVLFLDIDRMVEGVLVDCAFSKYSVMYGYDRNLYHPIGNKDEYCVQRDLLNNLEELKSLFTIEE
jgi:hypothetical protein